MRRISPGALILLVYDIFRIVVLIRTFGALTEALAGYERAAVMALGVPQALFAFMALFLLLDSNAYRPYVPLYTAGKILSGLLFFIISILMIPAVIENGAYINPANLARTGTLFAIGLFDVLSLIPMNIVNRRVGTTSRVGTTAQNARIENNRPQQPAEGVH